MYTLEIEKETLHIEKILDSGQVFRYERIAETGELILIHENHYVIVENTQDGYLFRCNQSEFDAVWKSYLDLERSYKEVNKRILEIDKRLAPIIHQNIGIRILKQASFEMLMTFIISQSKAIPQIRALVNRLSKEHGSLLGVYKGIEIYGFPTVKQLAGITETDFREMKFGYRAPYLMDAISKFQTIDDGHELLSTPELKEKLKSIKGVGDKVASCVLLFGYGRHKSFPIDVWMRKTVLELYGSQLEVKGRKQKDQDLEKFGLELFDDDAGIAQQYLFEYGRTHL